MKLFMAVVVTIGLAAMVVTGCDHPEQGCKSKDSAGNVDCPLQQYNPPDGITAGAR